MRARKRCSDKSSQTDRVPRAGLSGFLLGALAVVLFAFVLAPVFDGKGYFFQSLFQSSPGTHGVVSGGAFSGVFRAGELQAALGDGDYIFLPNRKNMWVVNQRNGLMIHYKYLDDQEGRGERSRVAQINQSIFPPGDTDYLLSDRNVIDFLWVCNRRTGDFQLWRRNIRDGRLTTDRDVLSPSSQLMTPVVPGSRESGR